MTKDTVWRQTSIWLFSAFVGASIPYALLLLLFLFPALRETTVFAAEFYPYLFGVDQPLGGISLSFTIGSFSTFWGVGITLVRPSFSLSAGWRLFTSRVCLHLAVGGLFLIVPLLSTLWALAIDGGEINRVLPWGVSEGNHGPWRYAYPLRMLLGYVFQIPIPVFGFGIVSLAIKPSKLTAVITVGSVIALYALIWSHYWLID